MSVGNPVTAAPAHSAVNVRAESQSRVWSLIRRAVNFLDRDRSEAWRCLKDAYTLLGEESVGDARVPRAVPAVQPGGLAAWQVRRAVDYIEEHLGAKMTTEDIAAAIGLSKSHFSRAFKSSLASSPMTYVAARRVERAKLMMISSAESLAEVALICGFADQSHLNRQFRRLVGVTPGQWRRSSTQAPGTIRSSGRSAGIELQQRPLLRHTADVAAIG